METQTLAVRCACGKKLKAPASAAGKKARCPACGSTVLLSPGTVASPPPIPVATARKTASIGLPADDQDSLRDLYDLAEQAESAPPPPATIACPKCRSEMEDGAIICVNCGYNSKTAKSLSLVNESKAPAKSAPRIPGLKTSGKPIDYMAPQGSFIQGLALSAAGAALASLLWVGMALATGFVISYIGILIGIAAGSGMNIGQKGSSKNGGIAAAGMTVAAILLAKLAVQQVVLGRHHPGESVLDLDGAVLAYYLFRPISLIIMVISMAAAFRTASGAMRA